MFFRWEKAVLVMRFMPCSNERLVVYNNTGVVDMLGGRVELLKLMQKFCVVLVRDLAPMITMFDLSQFGFRKLVCIQCGRWDVFRDFKSNCHQIAFSKIWQEHFNKGSSLHY